MASSREKEAYHHVLVEIGGKRVYILVDGYGKVTLPFSTASNNGNPYYIRTGDRKKIQGFRRKKDLEKITRNNP